MKPRSKTPNDRRSFCSVAGYSRAESSPSAKLKTAEFKILTRSHTPVSPHSSCEELTAIALSLRERVALGPRQRFRRVGVGLSNFLDPQDISAQPLFVRLGAKL